MIDETSPDDYCIFCRNHENKVGKLTDEHAIPYAMGGQLILRKSTCEKCRAATSKFETKFIKGPFNAFRFAAGLQSRSGKMPKTLPIFAVNGAEQERIEIASDLYPAMLTLPRFNGAVMLDNGKFNSLPTKPWCAIEWSRSERLLSQLGLTSFASISTNVYDFSRLIAKIAHCLTILEMGKTFSPTLCSIITEERGDNFRKYIRSSDNLLPTEFEREFTHTYQLSEVQIGAFTFLVGHLTLFSNLGAPTYDVVVGQKGGGYLLYPELDAEDIVLLPEHRIESYRFDMSRPNADARHDIGPPPVDVVLNRR